MGTNRRYADSLDHRGQLRDLARALAAGARVDSLHQVETELDREPVTVPPTPVSVRAYVRCQNGAYLVDAKAHRWTSRAVAIAFDLEGVDEPVKVWVWASAVRGR